MDYTPRGNEILDTASMTLGVWLFLPPFVLDMPVDGGIAERSDHADAANAVNLDQRRTKPISPFPPAQGPEHAAKKLPSQFAAYASGGALGEGFHGGFPPLAFAARRNA